MRTLGMSVSFSVQISTSAVNQMPFLAMLDCQAGYTYIRQNVLMKKRKEVCD